MATGPFNTAQFVASEAEDWAPTVLPSPPPTEYTVTIGGPPFSPDEPQRLVTTTADLKTRFAQYVLRKLPSLDGLNGAAKTDWRLYYTAMARVAQEPTSTLAGLSLFGHEPIQSLEAHFEDVLSGLHGPFHSLGTAWDNKPDKTDKGKGRTSADRKAQDVVPQWYDEACILCGFPQPQGAHIVPVRALRFQDAEVHWAMLRKFWPLSMVATHELITSGREETNILPLCPNTHWLWDKFALAIRPIAHPTRPQHSLYLQLLWLENHATASVQDTLSDFRRQRAGPHPGIQNGDVYELTTTDPAARPLPSLRLLQIQLGVHKLMSAIRAAAAAGDIFRGDPPDDKGLPVPSDLALPSRWEAALDAATGAGALDRAAADLWRVALLRHFLGLASNEEDDDEEEDEARATSGDRQAHEGAEDV
ncbi:hypothetical protein SCUCBS95973_008689 [Sporothrix curviconia]|uniref:HNH nuclease domain-containing protein n=1 Tax=Sporothrix curviconia TaxID=1260050 RepID=A0ABP0CR87_9PEZI